MKIEKILHVDDEPYEVSGIKEALSGKGYKVTTFVWPDDAEDPNNEEEFTKLPPFLDFDLVLLDVIMGQGDLGEDDSNHGFTTGIVFHRKILAKDFPDVPVFFLTALPDGAFNTQAREYAAANKIPYIRKSGEAVAEILLQIQTLELAASEGKVG